MSTKPLSEKATQIFKILQELADVSSNSVKIRIGEIGKASTFKNKSVVDSLSELVEAKYIHKLGPSLFIILKGLPK